ncbi:MULTISPECIES: hypothetical protein [unclassified Bradyrhizobium]|uniref:hypothetical protein n=1 Tax=Bradyrhizobium sp. USDA 4541 TaxID=2817704 RepID=UPI0020A552BF|nr:hypothetical protein [Bradyrhizobium sp. USDA 4541]MCP1854237.1 hypothetical protein [Bradyrhizobium sp. USDA 4541]
MEWRPNPGRGDDDEAAINRPPELPDNGKIVELKLPDYARQSWQADRTGARQAVALRQSHPPGTIGFSRRLRAMRLLRV